MCLFTNKGLVDGSLVFLWSITSERGGRTVTSWWWETDRGQHGRLKPQHSSTAAQQHFARVSLPPRCAKAPNDCPGLVRLPASALGSIINPWAEKWLQSANCIKFNEIHAEQIPIPRFCFWSQNFRMIPWSPGHPVKCQLVIHSVSQQPVVRLFSDKIFETAD